ncbi:MAG: hypothetical protein QOJ29_3840, partial [Thermoleophilaceae bacterium]|nr:hypothetical protein [Thermoleophilaceae bacterium]
TAISVWCGGRSPWYYYLRARYLGSPSAGPLPLNWKKVTLGSTSGCGAKQPPGVEAFAHKEIQRLYLKRLRHH